MMAGVTIVDEVSRASKALLTEVLSGPSMEEEWDNRAILREALREMSGSEGSI